MRDGRTAWSPVPTTSSTTDRLDDDGVPLANRTDVQVAQAAVVDGHLVCDRDVPVDLDLRRAGAVVRAD